MISAHSSIPQASNFTEKSGVDPESVGPLCRHILDTCPDLKLEGLMTIGKFGHDYATGPNPDFISLMKCHKEVCEAFGWSESEVEVSMGMSDDFDEAVSVLQSYWKFVGHFSGRVTGSLV